MIRRNNIVTPARAVHPGEILREELRERGISQKMFAKEIGVQASHLSEFIRGRRNMNESLAMKLEASLNIPFETWIRLHYGYLRDCKLIERKPVGAPEIKHESPSFIKIGLRNNHDFESGKLPFRNCSQVYGTVLYSSKYSTFTKSI